MKQERFSTLCVFCGSRTGSDPAFTQVAVELGTALAEGHIRLVYGGGNVGLMGVLADAVLAAHGQVTGVIPQSLVNRELAHAGVDDMRVVESMHARKALMAQLADGFLALPGGLGTFEELFEILTWAQLGFHHKPVAVLNVNGYFDPLLDLMDRAVRDGLLRSENRALLMVCDSAPQLLDCFTATEDTSNDEDDDAVRDLT